MEQLANGAYSYVSGAIGLAGSYVNSIKDIIWKAEEEVPELPLDKLRYYLKNISWHTKHSQDNIVVERICMMYAELLSCDKNRFQYFNPSVEKPIEYLGSEKELLVSLVGEMKIKSEKIKCNLIVTIVFHENIENELPLIYIRNPHVEIMQPNPYYRDLYEEILGGVTYSKTKKEELQKNWVVYKPNNLLNLVKTIEADLHEKLPFCKRNHKFIEHSPETEEHQLTMKLKEELKSCLSKNQSLCIYLQSLTSETEYLLDENKKLQKLIESYSETQSNIEEGKIMNTIKIEQNEELLDLLCQEKALSECIAYVEKHQTPEDLEFEEKIKLIEKFAGEFLETKFKIMVLMDHFKNKNNENM